eukprot:tig00000403_g328.t1
MANTAPKIAPQTPATQLLGANRLKGKVAIITGGGNGIGRCVARRMAAEGAWVGIVEIDDTHAEAVVKEIKEAGGDGKFWHMDITHETEVKKIIHEIHAEKGRIDILVNNAAILGPHDILTEDVPSDEWDEVMRINVKGAFLTCKCAPAGPQGGAQEVSICSPSLALARAFQPVLSLNPFRSSSSGYVFPIMRAGGGGSVINVSAVTGIVGRALITPYCTSKGAIRLMTKADAVSYARDHIRVNSVHPGAIKTHILEYLTSKPGWEKAIEGVPLGFFGDAVDVSNAIVFLASDEARFITGAELVVDGGWTAK